MILIVLWDHQHHSMIIFDMCIYVFQVVHEVYTRFTEESTVQSTWENNTESTEVEIKVGDFFFLSLFLILKGWFT